MPSPSGKTPDRPWISDDAVAQVISSKAHILSRSPGFTRSDQPDLEQEFRLHLLRKAHLYDASRSQPATFASRLIDNKAVSMLREIHSKRRSLGSCPHSLDEPVANTDVPLCAVLDESQARRHTGQRTRSAADQAQLRIDIEEANSGLSPDAKRLAALLCHVPLFAAGQVLGMSRRQSEHHFATLRARYEQRGLSA